MKSSPVKVIRLILGDQLNIKHSWYQQRNEAVLYVMMEVRQETDYTVHHVQKVLGFFGAMRNFSEALIKMGCQVKYFKLNDPDNTQSIIQNLKYLLDAHQPDRLEYQFPDEYRLQQQLDSWLKESSIPFEVFDTEHFLTHRKELQQFFEGKKTYRMENFYHYMRKKHDLLMEDGGPVGGQWNYDHENRSGFNKNIIIPAPKLASHDLRELHLMLVKSEVKMMGEVDHASFAWPLGRKESLQWLEYFATALLPDFGRYQDAMSNEHWSMFHSRLSFSLNTKMLHPLEVVHRVIAEWRKRSDEISLAQIEGFVRQIVGWREYMRGVYWARMPEFSSLNFFSHQRSLPSFFWTGKTKMNCVQKAVEQSLQKAYAHHIQRLMITGNFALLAGIHPDQVDEWYLGIYMDAIQWVEITNTRGMSQFADGGIVGSKPYVATANYINKMSDYCGSCHYQYKRKTGEGACPFNSLYWHFFERNRNKLSKNPRIGMAYVTLDKMLPEERQALLNQAEQYLNQIEEL